MTENTKNSHEQSHSLTNNLKSEKEPKGLLSFVDNRYSTQVQKELTETIQRKGYVDPLNPYSTVQIESKGTPLSPAGTRRSPELTQKIDLFKKELLTYIGILIKNSARKLPSKPDFGPHIAIFMVGDSWYISYNSDAKGGLLLSEVTMTVKELIRKYYDMINEKIQFEESEEYLSTNRMLFESPDHETIKEALYITFRWANNKKVIHVLLNEKLPPTNPPVPGQKMRARVQHGEMHLLDGLQNARLRTTKPHMRMNRVLRVGGTLPPCYNCFGELYGTQVRDANSNLRTISTMSAQHGFQFDRWVRNASDMAPKVENKNIQNADQNQTYDNLNEGFRQLCDIGLQGGI